MPETAEEVCQRPEVRDELARTTGQKAEVEVKTETKDKLWFVTHALLLLGCAVLYYLIGSKFIPLSQSQADLSHRLLRGFAMIVVVLAAAKAVKVYAIGRISGAVTRFTLQRIENLVAALLVAVIAISVRRVARFLFLAAVSEHR